MGELIEVDFSQRSRNEIDAQVRDVGIHKCVSRILESELTQEQKDKYIFMYRHCNKRIQRASTTL